MLWIELDRTSSESLTRQLYNTLTEMIISGELQEDYRMAPTRKMAKQLQVSRNVVLEVYEQLKAEGYLIAREGSGTYVASGTNYDTKSLVKKKKAATTKRIDNRQFRPSSEPSSLIDFGSVMPDLSQFPRTIWARMMRDAYMTRSDDYFGYCDPQGIFELRYAIANHLSMYKGVKCKPDQVVITLGSIQAFDIIHHLLHEDIDTVITEDPSYEGIYRYFQRKDYQMISIPVDKQGLIVDQLPNNDSSKIISVTPSHQFPMGCMLSIQRRIKLLEYAEKTGSYILENDYGGDYNYLELPIKSCYAISPDQVFHIGTFSKSMFPALRTGYLVIPESFIEPYNQFKYAQHLGTTSVAQYVLARFIEEKYYIRYLNKMKKIYDRKRVLMVSSLKEAFGDSIYILPGGYDYYMVIAFRDIRISQEAYSKCLDYDIDFALIETNAKKKGFHDHEILLNFGSLTDDQISDGIIRLKKFIDSKVIHDAV